MIEPIFVRLIIANQNLGVSMGIVRRFVGPKSKYNKSIPYTYVAKVRIVEGDDGLVNHYFADTICGLIEYLDGHNIEPEEVELAGCYLKKEIEIDKCHCIDKDGKWLQPPNLCRSLESQYKKTMEEAYKGHVERGECSFEDREKEGSGPF
jgi:hypothetical protein